MAVPVIGLVALLTNLVARFFTVEVLKMIAFKTILITIVVTVLPAVIESFMVSIFNDISNYVVTQMPDSETMSQAISITGLFGWLAQVLKIPESISVVVGAYSLRFALNFIPFLRI